MDMTEIAEKLEVSRVSLSRWAKDGGWKETRAARQITRPELVNKLLLAIDRLLDQVNGSEDPSDLAGLGDKLAKMSAVIEKLDKKVTIIDTVEVFMAFSKWLEFRSQTDPELTPELIKTINRYQDSYIIDTMGKSGV